MHWEPEDVRGMGGTVQHLNSRVTSQPTFHYLQAVGEHQGVHVVLMCGPSSLVLVYAVGERSVQEMGDMQNVEGRVGKGWGGRWTRRIGPQQDQSKCMH